MYCKNCGKEIPDSARFCDSCGTAADATAQQPVINIITNSQAAAPELGASPKNKWVAFLLCFFLGGLGIHRFYVGKTGTGVLWLLTAGCFGIGALIDIIQIACGNFTDSDGLRLTSWDA